MKRIVLPIIFLFIIGCDSNVNYKDKGISLLDSRKYERAVDAFDKALKKDPSISTIWYYRGKALFGIKEFKKSIDSYNKAIILDPKRSAFWNEKGKALYECKKYDEALTSYNKAIEITSGMPEYWVNKETVLKKLGREKEAFIAFFYANSSTILEPIRNAVKNKDYKIACKLSENYLKTNDYELLELYKFAKKELKNYSLLLDFKQSQSLFYKPNINTLKKLVDEYPHNEKYKFLLSFYKNRRTILKELRINLKKGNNKKVINLAHKYSKINDFEIQKYKKTAKLNDFKKNKKQILGPIMKAMNLHSFGVVYELCKKHLYSDDKEILRLYQIAEIELKIEQLMKKRKEIGPSYSEFFEDYHDLVSRHPMKKSYYKLVKKNNGYSFTTKKFVTINGRKEKLTDTSNLVSEGIFYIEIKQYDSAINIFDKALNINPNNLSALYNKSVALNHLKEYDHALILLKKITRKDPKYHLYWNELGNSYLYLKEYQLASESYQKATKLNPKNPVYYSNLGKVLLFLKKDQEALKAYNNVITLPPERIDYLIDSGDLLFKYGKYRNAIKIYDKVIGISKKGIVEYDKSLIQSKKKKQKIKDATKIELNGKEISFDKDLAYELLKYSAAINAYNKTVGIKNDPDYWVYLNLSGKLILLKRYKSKTINKNHSYSLLKKAESLYNIKRYNEAANSFKQLIKFNKSNIHSYIKLSELEIITGNHYNISIGFEKSSKLEDKILFTLFKTIKNKIKNKTDVYLEIQLNRLLNNSKGVEWSFSNFKSWLKSSNIENAKKQYILNRINTLPKKINT